MSENSNRIKICDTKNTRPVTVYANQLLLVLTVFVIP